MTQTLRAQFAVGHLHTLSGKIEMRLLILVLLISLWMPNVIAKSTNGQQFRIETEVSYVEQEQIASRNLTLFSSGYVHDFLTTSAVENPADEPETIVIWDRLRQELVLLDIEREIKATISQEEIIRFSAALMAREELRKREPFLFEPKFETVFDEVKNSLTLSSDRMTYVTSGESPDDKIALDSYHEFADWYVRLNAVDPTKMPPFARLELNRKIREHKFIPVKVELTLKPSGRGNAEIKLRSRHDIIWQLSVKDQSRITVANELKTTFREATLQEFYKVQMPVLN